MKTALITGATSGIGRAFAFFYAGKGYDLILTGRRKEAMERTATELGGIHSGNIEVRYLELSDFNQVNALAEEMKKRRIDVLVNNAGFGCKGYVFQGDTEEYLKMVRLHVVCTLRFTLAVLGQMVERDEGTVINVASDAAYMAVPQNAVYAATKAFIKHFTEGVYLDLRSAGSHVSVQALCPGLTKTDFQLKMGMDPKKRVNHGFLRWQEPGRVVTESMKALKRNRPICICGGWMGQVEKVLATFLPKKLYYIIILSIFH